MSRDHGSPIDAGGRGGSDPAHRRPGCDAFWEWRLPSGEPSWSRGLLEAFGQEDADIVPDVEWWVDRVHPDDRERVEAELDDRLASARTWETRFRFRRADGEHVAVALDAAVVRTDGEPERLVGTMAVLDDGGRVDPAPEDGERVDRVNPELAERYRTLVEQNLVGISMIRDGEIVHLNPRLAEILGYDRAELLGTDPFGHVPAGHRDEVLADVYRLVDGEVDEATASGPVSRKGGGTAYVESYLRRIEYRGEDAYLAVTVDVTDRVEAKRDLEHERERLDVLNAMLRHHVLNGMNIVLANSDHLATDAEGNRLDRLETISRRGSAIVDLVQTIRSLVRTVRTSEARGFEPVDLPATLERSVEAASARHDDATVQLVAPSGDDLHVLADGMLSTVFDELVENAVVHADAAGPRIEVRVEADGATVSVHVADRGPGIPRSVREDLVEDGSSSGGTGDGGFGMTVAQLLVTLYDGSMRIRDREPRGTIVTVTLPRVAPENGSATA